MKPAPWSKAADRTGAFKRKQSEFRDTISPAGGHPPVASRYHLYVSYACPWAHRTLITRRLLGLDEVSFDVVDWHMNDDGSWRFDPAVAGCTKDRLHGATNLQDIYQRADPDFSGIGTVPVLWDKDAGTIVNNESREIVRMFDVHLAPEETRRKLLPDGLEADVDAMIDANYESVNNGVYKAGFARSQDAYDEGVAALFARLEELDLHLEGRDWLVGPGAGTLTEADVCLWPTLARMHVYHTHFKCNIKTLQELPNVWAFTKRFYQLPGVADTVHWDHIEGHYYWSHTSINPHRIVAQGPDMQALLGS